MDLRRTHFERLKENVPGTVETSQIHLELVDSLKRISSNATNIARIFLEGKRNQGAETETESLNEDQVKTP